MRNLWSRYWIWVVVAAALWMFSGCEMHTDGFQTVSIDGGLDIKSSIDSVSSQDSTVIDTKSVLDSIPDTKHVQDLQVADAQTVPDLLGLDALPLLDTFSMDTKSTLDQKPGSDVIDCPIVTVQKPSDPYSTLRWSVTVKATSTAGFCFKTCDTPIFSFGWDAFTDRTLTINGKPFALLGPICQQTAGGCVSMGSLEIPSVPSGMLIFQVSAGSSSTAAFTWTGGSNSCSGHEN